MNEDRATERAHRIADDIAPIARHTEQGGVAVSAELDPLQLLAHHIDEDTLSVANNDERRHHIGVDLVGGEVVEDLGAVGVQLARSECVADAHLAFQRRESGAHSLHWDTGATDGRQRHRFSQTDERDARRAPLGRERRHDGFADGCWPVGPVMHVPFGPRC